MEMQKFTVDMALKELNESSNIKLGLIMWVLDQLTVEDLYELAKRKGVIISASFDRHVVVDILIAVFKN